MNCALWVKRCLLWSFLSALLLFGWLHFIDRWPPAAWGELLRVWAWLVLPVWVIGIAKRAIWGRPD